MEGKGGKERRERMKGERVKKRKEGKDRRERLKGNVEKKNFKKG